MTYVAEDDGRNKDTGDPTFPGCEIEGEETEILRAASRYKTRYNKSFLTILDMVRVLKEMGYHR